MACHQPQESLVSSTQDRTSSWLKAVDESRSVSDASDRDSLINSHGSEKSVVTVDEHEQSHSFPWLASFSHKCGDLVDRKFDLPILHNLMTEFVTSLTADVNECYKKPNRAAKLKKVVNEYLLFFHMIYLDIKEPLEHLPYLNRMSDLLAMYVDLEIKASRRRKEHAKIICGKLTAALFVFLRYSIDHILDTMLKTRLMARSSMEISAPVLGRVLRDKPLQPICEMTYVRYILVYKLWKKVVRGAEERRRINKQASSLVTPPEEFRKMSRGTMLDGILPSIPKSRTDITQFFMQAKFSVKEKAKAFLKLTQDPNRASVGLVPNFAPDLDKSLFYDDFVESSSRFGCSPIREERGKSLLDEVYNTMSDSASTNDLITDEVLGRASKNNLSPDMAVKKKKVNDVLSKKLTKKKLKNKELKLDLCDSTKKNKNKDANKIGKIPSSPLAKVKNKKVKKEVPVEMLSKLKISGKDSGNMLSRSLSPAIDENVDVIKKFSATNLMDCEINGGSSTTDKLEKKNKSFTVEEVTEDDDDEEEEDDDADDEDDDKSSVSAVTFKEESQSQEEKEAEADNVSLSFTNRIITEKDKEIITEKEKEQNKDEVNLKTSVNTSNNDVSVIVEETQRSDTVQCTAITSDDNNMLIDKSEDTNDNDVSFRGFPLATPTRNNTPSDTVVLDEDEPKVDIATPNDTVAQDEDEPKVEIAEPILEHEIALSEPVVPNQVNSFTENEDSNSSDCIIEGVYPAPNTNSSQRSQLLNNTSVIKTEDTDNVNFELAGILEQDGYSVYPVQPPEEQSEIGGEEFLTGLMQQWSSQDEIYTYHPSYDLDVVVEPVHNIITVSTGEEDIISGNGDAFFGSICNGVMVTDDREGDSPSTRSSYESGSNIRDGKITYRGKTQPTIDCSPPERSSSDVNVQTCMSDSEPQTPASCESESSPDVSLNTTDVPLTSPSAASSSAVMKSVETSTFSPFVSLSRTNVNEHQSSSRLNSLESVSYNSNKKGIKRKAVSFRDTEQPPSKHSQRQEESKATSSRTNVNSENSREKGSCSNSNSSNNNNSSSSSSSTGFRREKEDSLMKSIETSSRRNDSNNNSGEGRGAGNSSDNSSSFKDRRESKDSRSSTSTSRGMLKMNKKSLLHNRTVQNDHRSYTSQEKFRCFYLNENIPPSSIPLPYHTPTGLGPPLFDDFSSNKISMTENEIRCNCDVCRANHSVLLGNFNKLNQYRNLRLKNYNESVKENENLLRTIEKSLDSLSSETVLQQESELSDSTCGSNADNLPLKKRKVFLSSDKEHKIILDESDKSISYPCTPMISIAQLELDNNNLSSTLNNNVDNDSRVENLTVDHLKDSDSLSNKCNVRTGDRIHSISDNEIGMNKHKLHQPWLDSSGCSICSAGISDTVDKPKKKEQNLIYSARNSLINDQEKQEHLGYTLPSQFPQPIQNQQYLGFEVNPITNQLLVQSQQPQLIQLQQNQQLQQMKHPLPPMIEYPYNQQKLMNVSNYQTSIIAQPLTKDQKNPKRRSRKKITQLPQSTPRNNTNVSNGLRNLQLNSNLSGYYQNTNYFSNCEDCRKNMLNNNNLSLSGQNLCHIQKNQYNIT